METLINSNKQEQSTRSQLKDILLEVSWAKVSKQYFGKSSSWIYNKLNDTDGNGNKSGFTSIEKEQFKNALFDLSERIRKTAQNFK